MRHVRVPAPAIALAFTLSTGTALAGTPFGGDDTGFVPPNRDVLRCEDTIGQIATRDVVRLIQCHLLASAVMLMTGRPFVDEPREQRCAANLVRAANALLARNICPPCITQVDPATVSMANEQTIDAATGLVACAGTTPSGATRPASWRRTRPRRCASWGREERGRTPSRAL